VGRVAAMYGASIAIQGKMHNISLYVRSYFVQPATRWNVIRCAPPFPPGSATRSACGCSCVAAVSCKPELEDKW